MSTTARCSKCGAPVSDEVAGGFCTACLLEEGLSAAELERTPIAFRYFGDYEMIEEIARGGMGVVFKARQRSLNRIVAVKMILSGHLASEAEAQRFRAEARAAAALQHPGIVAIHEVGEHEGLLFFSMDYVEGQNLAQLVRDGPWSATRAAQCVREIAEAIHYAHERGVLHRDLKPSNVLIDSSGKPHVTDFGLAKQLNADGQLSNGEHSLTVSGQVLGSPNFMPPEQAAGKHRDLTPASDVYSLGALLYHLLTGRPPFLAENIPATLRLVCETEPVAPRLLAPTVPRDLETICLKCLEKDPQRRYATANELAEELQRFLNHEPIRARPISAAGKSWRWSRRNPGLARTAAAALVLFLAVTIGGPIALIQINDARKQAETRQKEAALEAARSQQFAQFMKAMLRSAGPSVARGRDATLLRELLEKTSARLETELRNQPEVQGDMYATLGNTYRDMGDYQHAIPMLEKAVVKYREAFGGDHKKLAVALGYLGEYQSFNTDVVAGKLSAQAGLEMARRCGDPETLAICLLNVAHSFEGWGMTATQGLPYASEAAALRRKLTNNPTALADCLSFMAGATLDSDRVEAERLAREALELNSRNLEPDHPSVVGDIFMLGQIQLDRGKFAEAEANLKETLRLHRKIYDRSHPHRFIVLRLLGDALTKQGKQAEFETEYLEALRLDGDTPNALEAVDKLASIWRAQGKRAEADQLVQDYTTRWRQNATNDLVSAALLTALANRAAEQKNFNEGAALGRQAVEIELKLASNNLPRLITTLGAVAAILDNAGRYSESEQLLEQRLGLQRGLYASNDVQIADALGWMAWVYTKDKKFPEEESALRERLAIQEKHFGSEHTNLLETLDRLASNLETQHKLKEAGALRQQSLAICEKVFGYTNAEVGMALNGVINSLNTQERHAELESFLKHETEKLLGSAERSTVTASNLLARMQRTRMDVLSRQKRWAEAGAAVSEVVSRETNPKNSLGLADLLRIWADRLTMEKSYEEAEALGRQSLEIQERFGSNNLPAMVASLGSLSVTLDKAGKNSDAAETIARKVDYERTLYGNNDRRLADTLGWRAVVLARDKRFAEAEPLIRERSTILKEKFGAADTKTLGALEWLANNLVNQDKQAEAEKTRKETLATCRSELGISHPETVLAFSRYISLLLKNGKLNEARSIALEVAAAAPDDLTVMSIVADVSARAGQWDDAIINYSRLIDAKADEPKARLRRGEIYGRTGRLKEAAIDLARAVELNPTDIFGWRNLAPVLVINGDVESYRQLCQRMLAQFGNTKDSGIADNTAKDCLLLSSSGADLDAVSKLADLAVTKAPPNEQTNWTQLCKMMAEYRQSHFADAILTANKVLAARNRQGERDATAYVVLAMAQKRANEETRARLALDKANEIVHGLPRLDSGDLGRNWHDRIILEILLREAEGLIQEAPSKAIVDAKADK